MSTQLCIISLFIVYHLNGSLTMHILNYIGWCERFANRLANGLPNRLHRVYIQIFIQLVFQPVASHIYKQV
jgi:hypothetical protein